jgi:hypothetical protein
VHIHRDRKGKGKDGQDRTYVSVVHSTWEATTAGKKRAKPEVFACLVPPLPPAAVSPWATGAGAETLQSSVSHTML